MSFRVVYARQVHDFVLWLKFSDGVEGEFDLLAELYGPIFEPLRTSTSSDNSASILASIRSCGRTEPILRRSFSRQYPGDRLTFISDAISHS